jgi:protein involved in polysaccharide export with SLBB domain
MKNLVITALFVMTALASSAAAQVKSVAVANKPPTSQPPVVNSNTGAGTRARVFGVDPKSSNKTESEIRTAPPQTELKNHNEAARVRRASDSIDMQPALNPPATKNSKKGSSPTAIAPQPSNLFTNYSAVSMASTQVYRVGINDVLDIQIEGNAGKESTLFTVNNDGLVEYPLAGDPIVVAGLTTQEIVGLLKQRIRVFDNPVVSVNVRDYASHAVTVTGFVAAPGRKVLRREAVPLYAMLAEALVLPEAGRATITRAGRSPIVADLKDSNHMATLVTAGDIIRVSGAPIATEFFFIGGAIGSPGQKPFHSGLTLSQALLASGGTTAKSDARIRVSRLGPNGRLINEEHSLKKIQSGKAVDPVLAKDDRIEVMPID